MGLLRGYCVAVFFKEKSPVLSQTRMNSKHRKPMPFQQKQNGVLNSYFWILLQRKVNNLLLIFVTKWVFHTKNSATIFHSSSSVRVLSPLTNGLQKTHDATEGKVSHSRLNFTADFFTSSKLMYFKICWFQNKSFESLLNLNCRCCRDKWLCIGQILCPSMCMSLAHTVEDISWWLGHEITRPCKTKTI